MAKFIKQNILILSDVVALIIYSVFLIIDKTKLIVIEFSYASNVDLFFYCLHTDDCSCNLNIFNFK